MATENWRIKPIEYLTNKFGIHMFDPNADPKQQKSYQLKEAKAQGDWETVKKVASGFVRKDLAQIDRSDFIIARFAYDKVYYESDFEVMEGPVFTIRYNKSGPHLRQVPTTGTIHEIVNSDLYHKPTLLICELGIQYIPTWLFGFVPLRYLFGSWDDLYKYLEKVDAGECQDDTRWNYVYGLV